MYRLPPGRTAARDRDADAVVMLLFVHVHGTKQIFFGQAGTAVVGLFLLFSVNDVEDDDSEKRQYQQPESHLAELEKSKYVSHTLSFLSAKFEKRR